MRRSTEKVIAVQLPTLLVAVTAFLRAQLLGDSRRGRAPANLLSWRGITASSTSPWPSRRRLIGREFWAGRNPPVATAPAKTADENTRAE